MSFLKGSSKFAYFLFLDVIARSILLCFVVTFVVYLLLSVAPKTEEIIVPLRGQEEYMVSQNMQTKLRQEQKFTAEAKNKKTRISYVRWLSDIFKGDMGRGATGQEISEEIKQRFPVTFILAFTSIIPALLISFILGLFPEVVWIKKTKILIYIVTSLPAFFLGYLLIALFGLNLSITPVRYILPVLTLSLSSGIVNEMSRIISSGINEEMSKDYIETARCKGLHDTIFPFFGTVKFHAFRNALISILPKIGLLFAFIISGSMVVEQVFNLPGLSYMLLGGLGDKDTVRVLIVMLLAVALVRIGSVLADFFYLLLNPRYGQR